MAPAMAHTVATFGPRDGAAKRRISNHDGADDGQPRVKKAKQHASQCNTPKELVLKPHEELLALLKPRYDVRMVSVLSSSKVAHRVELIMRHLAQFHPTNLTVLPGVVLLHARAEQAGKMILVAETVKKSIHANRHKWYQYNRVYEVEVGVDDEPSVVEETVFPDGMRDVDAADTDEDDAFETMAPQFVAAIVQPNHSTTHKTYMSIFLSRVPLPELKCVDFMTAQSNERAIQQLYK